MYLYLTADKLSRNHGGGRVVLEESQALRELADEHGEAFRLVSRDELERALRDWAGAVAPDPWHWDKVAYCMFGNLVKLCHVYAGTFTESVKKVQDGGGKVVYTTAAHSVEASRRAHEELGIPYARLYPHLCEPELFRRYIGGYLRADAVVVPSQHSAAVVRDQGVTAPVTVVPHGVDVPEVVVPIPKRFTVGYLGAVGPDKGLRYLFAAWKKLNYKDAVLLVGGKDSTSDFVRQLWNAFGGGNVRFTGWVDDIADFYNQISLYVQPSVSEGFGIEVLEACAHWRPVLCSEGAGAAYLLGKDYVFPAGDVDALAAKIDRVRGFGDSILTGHPWPEWREYASVNTWDKIRARYKQLWREVLG